MIENIEFWMWVFGGMAAVIILLLGMIAFFVRQEKEEMKNTLTKHETWILVGQREQSELSKKLDVSMAAVNSSLEANRQIMEFVIEHFKK